MHQVYILRRSAANLKEELRIKYFDIRILALEEI
jgi:hypothetical protein